MKLQKIFSFIVLLLVATSVTFSQEKKEITSVQVAMRQDTTVNYKKPQTATTYGYVTVAGNRINYQAETGTLILKDKMDSPTISMSYVAYFKEDKSSGQADNFYL